MTDWVLASLAASTMLMALVLLLRGPVARAFGPHAAYALWALPALRMVLPDLPGVGLLPAVHFAHGDGGGGLLAAPSLPVSPSLTVDNLADHPMAAAMPGPLDYAMAHGPAVLVALWLGGAALWFGWQMLRYHHFLAQALRSAEPIGSECGIDVLLSVAVGGPVAAGVFRRRIFLPASFMTRYTAAERRCALLHEAAHHDRYDVVANFVALVVVALHWWNPLAHRAYKAFRADQELACDATVLADMAASERHAYGSAVVKSASARMPGVACALSNKDEIKQRLRQMAAPRFAGRRVWAGLALVMVTIGAGLMATASSPASAQAEPVAVRAAARVADQAAAQADMAGRRATRDARRAERARVKVMRASALVLDDADAARHQAMEDAAQDRADAERDRAELARERTEAQRDRQDAMRERQQAMREAVEARGQAMAEAAAARAEAQRELAQARRDIDRARSTNWR
ncbi:M56 family metallopeptidase [Novosphingobium sp. KACC 22771]|uniref:M56 family metallopeptidase n=1 Tax=Novosphingobium sp. KACC 22771 TaxID=3025670 RepID=UPI002366E803|nr:M56 family metallopeptidase [Novosphingobium sp. KACC 22771]WDF71747.1 M56 family metallopeptidase [Novosphingobium sp. KACC 22771]